MDLGIETALGSPCTQMKVADSLIYFLNFLKRQKKNYTNNSCGLDLYIYVK